ncbi:MAG: sirohydrochlorin cobaltochelatase [Bacillota bacterium]|nr:sirohydrochlorin cobaltochelatase [Bacillota bacterium]
MKKAILVVSFGTTHQDTMEATIKKIEEKVEDKFKEYEIRRAFTAHQIIKILKERDGVHEDTPEEALSKLHKENFSEVVVQPLHIIPGDEYEYIKYVVDKFRALGVFEKLILGRPVLYFKGDGEEIPDDYSIFVEAMNSELTKLSPVVLMGHGSTHPANSSYNCLQEVLRDKGFDNAYIATVEGYPTIDYVIEKVKTDGLNQVSLMPLMLVAGEHAKNDMQCTWKELLEKEEIQASVYLHGLGEIEKFQDIYIEHIEDAIKGKYIEPGKIKKLANI